MSATNHCLSTPARSEKIRKTWSQRKDAAILLGAILVGFHLGGFISSKLYMIQSIKKNKQHVANIFWIQKYVKSMRSGI